MSLRWLFFVASLVVNQLPFCAAIPNCALTGAEFPPPQTLSRHPEWQQALEVIRTRFDYIDGGGTGDIDGISYSVQIFSTNPGGELLGERHRTSPNLTKDTAGVKQVDGNTVYRLGSVSKVFAVLAWLAELGDVHWTEPVTKYIPELANLSAQAASKPFNAVRDTSWDDITIGALASQISGLGRDCKFPALPRENGD
jgi:CubicO group peptidase (beta-lactamase class C family)